MQKPPETGRMVQLFDMAEFVKEYVAHQLGRNEKKAAVKTDVVQPGATGPTRGLAPDCGLLEGDSYFLTDFPEPRR